MKISFLSLSILFALTTIIRAEPDLLVLMNGSGVVERYNEKGEHLGAFITGVRKPNDMVFGPDGQLYISTGSINGPGTVRRYDGKTGRFLGEFISRQAPDQPGALVRASGMVWHDGDLFVVSSDNGKVFRYDGRTGAFKSEVANGSPGGITQISIQSGKLYLADYLAHGVRRFDLATGAAEGFAVQNLGFSPWGVTLDEQGDIFWSGEPGTICRFDGQKETVFAGPLAELSKPLQLKFGPNGLLYCAAASANKVTAWNAGDGSLVQTFGGDEMKDPISVAFTDAPMPEQSVTLLKGENAPGQPVVRVSADLAHGGLSFLSWDTEAGDRAKLNLLLTPVTITARIGDRSVILTGPGEMQGTDKVVFRLKEQDFEIIWSVQVKDGGMRMTIGGSGKDLASVERLELAFPFDPSATATGPVAGEWTDDEKLQLPALINAPDLGVMRLSSPDQSGILGRWEGSRGRVDCFATLTLELPKIEEGTYLTLLFEPINLLKPAGIPDEETWVAARRGWLNLLQTSTKRPAEAGKLPCPAGVWANNIISDPVSATLFWLGDHVLLLPQLTSDISATSLLRRTVELYMNGATAPDGAVNYVWRDGLTMDANPALLTAAWAYVEASGDVEWFVRNAEKLELISNFTEKRNLDEDGLVESHPTGNHNSRAFGDSAFDVISSGHKNAYINALVYRAWRGMAQLQKKAGRMEKSAHFTQLADDLKKVYRETFYNPETGWLGWWRSEDGALHDLWSDVPTSLAIAVGLIEPDDGAKMMDRYWEELQKTGFKHFEVGIPLTLRPIPPALMLQGYGGQLEDGSDTFGKYLNGGACVSNTSYWLIANNIVGRQERADMVMNAMLKRQKEGVFFNGGGFQNGIIDRAGEGAEFMTWDGEPCGYEGFLVYSWTWLSALALKDPDAFQRVYGLLH